MYPVGYINVPHIKRKLLVLSITWRFYNRWEWRTLGLLHFNMFGILFGPDWLAFIWIMDIYGHYRSTSHGCPYRIPNAGITRGYCCHYVEFRCTNANSKTHMHAQTHAHTHMHANTLTHILTHMHTHPHAHTCTHTCTHTLTHMHTDTGIYCHLFHFDQLSQSTFKVSILDLSSLFWTFVSIFTEWNKLYGNQ